MTEINVPAVAGASDRDLQVELSAAPPRTLHGRYLWRTDGNSPLRIRSGTATVFFSGYEPRGHTLRRVGPSDLQFQAPPLPVMILDDPDPVAGKWIEAVWQAPGGPLFAWCHVEEPAPGGSGLMLPRIDWLISWDEGLVWRWRGTLLRLPTDQAEPGWRNGFFAGGFGDLSVVAGGSGRLYLFFSSYHPREEAQGVSVLRLLAADPGARPELWTATGWRVGADAVPCPLWSVRRGFRHPDPDAFWGPAVHYNRALRGWVMMLNRTAGGHRDFRQEGIYVSLSRALDDPLGWSPPMKIVAGGAWYPQAIGLGEGEGDTEAGTTARFFMAGFSAWQIHFGLPGQRAAAFEPLVCSGDGFARLFGTDRRCPW